MPDQRDRKRAAAESFDTHAEAYLSSTIHRDGADLDRIASWCAGADRALDVATGAGHTAGAIKDHGVDLVVAADAAPGMLTTARSAFPGLSAVTADAERLPFTAGSFDAVACRIAAHHFPDPAAFVGETARVLRAGGTLAIEDNVAPPDVALDRFINRIERLRDPTHVRSHTVAEWRAWLDSSGFTVEESTVIRREIEYGPWLDQLDVPHDRRATLEETFADAPPAATEAFGITRDDAGSVETFSNLKALIRATR